MILPVVASRLRCDDDDATVKEKNSRGKEQRVSWISAAIRSQQSRDDTMLSSNKSRGGLVAVLTLLMVLILLMETSLVPPAPSQTFLPRNTTTVDTVQMARATVALAPGELPGYTGWARPERTLAGFFSVQSISTHQPTVGTDFMIKLWCHGDEDCAQGKSMFYLRAYGPSVIPGLMQSKGLGKYIAIFNFPDPGFYTVEVVLTYSNPPRIEEFPLPFDQAEPSYEGYLLPGFPMQVSVLGSELSQGTPRLCRGDDLLETSPTSAANKARWKVVEKSNAPDHYVKSKGISKAGYLRSVNSIGVQMEYQYRSGCSLLSEAAFEQRVGEKQPFSKCGDKKLHVVFVGDSVMRIQEAAFKGMVENLPNIQSSYVSLYGGYRRVVALEPFVTELEDIRHRSANDIKVVIFNSGIHDIVRLCGREWKDDRYEYLDEKTLNSGSFSCVKEYRSLMHDLALEMVNFEADLRIFQSTSAAWPRYGNFGIEWPFAAQSMPMATDVVQAFYDVAFDILRKNFATSIDIVDGYWITYGRPDNREIGEAGGKLAHPGVEVLSAMIRMWAMLVLDKLCAF